MLSHEVGFSSPPAAYRPQKGVVGVSCVPVPHASIHDSGCEKLKEATKNGSEDTGIAGWPLVVVSFYKFASLPDCQEMRAPLRELCETHVRLSLWLLCRHLIMSTVVLYSNCTS